MDHVDLLVGGLVEQHVPGSRVGPLFGQILCRQLRRTRTADPLFFTNEGTRVTLHWIV